MAEYPRLYAEELARRLWEAFRGRRVTLDRFGRPNYIVTLAFARQLLSLAAKYGVEDPLHEIDWLGIIDPDVSREENLRRVEEYLASLYGERRAPGEELAEAITELERYLAYLREELGRAPPEARPSIEEEIRRVERELEELRRRERRARPPRRRERPRAAAPSPPPGPRPEPVSRLPLEEARAAIEAYVRSRVPRVYRFDWSDLRARISYHRSVEGELRRAVGELGGRVERVVEARPPLRIMYVDFSAARAPPVAVPAYLERYILWSKFSAALTAAGLRPEEYRGEFEAVLRETEGLPLEERQRRVEELARRIVSEHRPPVVAVIPREVSEMLRRIEERIERLEAEVREAARAAGAAAAPAPEEVRAAMEALFLPEPRLMVRVDEAGHPFIGPDDKCMETLKMFLDRWAVLYFSSCPACRFRLPGGALSPTEFVEHMIEKEAAVPPFMIDWLRRLARMIEEAERRGVPAA